MASSYFDALHQSHGVAIYTNTQVSGILPSDHQVTVNASNNSSIDADLVIAGIGVIPDMDIAAKAGIKTDNGIRTDTFYRTNKPDIFAIGDVAFRQMATNGPDKTGIRSSRPDECRYRCPNDDESNSRHS